MQLTAYIKKPRITWAKSIFSILGLRFATIGTLL